MVELTPKLASTSLTALTSQWSLCLRGISHAFSITTYTLTEPEGEISSQNHFKSNTMSAPAEPAAEGATVPAPTPAPAAPGATEEQTIPPITEATTAPKVDAETAAGTPLSKLFAELPAILKEADHHEMWGVDLKDETDVPTCIVLEKFLRANPDDLTKAKSQLLDALKWRKQIQPVKLLEETEFDTSKFGGLGYVTIYENTKAKPPRKEIVTWNIYGSVKDNKATFGNVDEFVKWRAALMELSVRELNLPAATEKIPHDGPDPYRMVQVHDYLNVTFLRMDPAVKAASKETIRVFGMAYPELLKEKFFVNVPLIMGWMFAAMKLFLSAETVKKFHPLSYGSSLASQVPDFGDQLPTAYGGKGQDVKTGMTVKYASAETK